MPVMILHTWQFIVLAPAQLVEIRETMRGITVPRYVEVEQPAPPKPALFAGKTVDICPEIVRINPQSPRKNRKFIRSPLLTGGSAT